jgi:hypothetical protein
LTACAKEATGLGREQWGQRPPLDPPILALDYHQPIPQGRTQQALLQRILTIIGGVVDKHTADRRRIVDDCGRTEDGRANKNRQFEMRVGPGLDGVPPQG